MLVDFWWEDVFLWLAGYPDCYFVFGGFGLSLFDESTTRPFCSITIVLVNDYTFTIYIFMAKDHGL